MSSQEDNRSFGERVRRYLDDQDQSIEAARSVANDESASPEERAQAIAELQAIQARLEQRAPMHIDRLLNFALDPTVEPEVRAASRRWFIELNWFKEDDFLLQTRAELHDRIVAIMKAQGRWPDEAGKS